MADLKSNPTYQAIKELSLALIYLTRFGNAAMRRCGRAGLVMTAKLFMTSLRKKC